MKEKWGQDLVEDWLLGPEQREELLTQAEEMQRDYEESRRIVMDYDDEDDELSGEASSWSSFLDGFFFKMAVPSGSILSEKTINTVNIPTVRQLSEGAGAAQGNEDALIQKQWFIGYACEYLTQASDHLAEGREGWLSGLSDGVLVCRTTIGSKKSGIDDPVIAGIEGRSKLHLLDDTLQL